MLAYREWRVFLSRDDLRPILVSTYMYTAWVTPELDADQPPEDLLPLGPGLGQLHGIHAVTDDYPRPVADGQGSSWLHCWPGAFPGEPLAAGAVELWGKVVEHEDGVLRAEHARVLAVRLVLPRDPCPQRCGRWLGTFPSGACTQGPPPHVPLAVLSPVCLLSAHVDEAALATADQAVLALRRQNWHDLCAGRALPPYRADELDRLLRERYEVPRLPDDAGPWARRAA